MEFDELSNRVIGCAIEVHRVLGPGLLESSYEQCLAYELVQAGITTVGECVWVYEYQHPLPLSARLVESGCWICSSV